MSRTKMKQRLRSREPTLVGVRPTSTATKVNSPRASLQELGSYYIYGVAALPKQASLKGKGIDPFAKPYTIPFRDLSAIVSRVKYEEYDPSDDNILVHNQVLQELHNSYGCTVLPFRFSTIARSQEDVLKILSSGYQKFKEKLAELRGKTEMAIRIYCNIEPYRKHVLSETRLRNPLTLQKEMSRRTRNLASKALEQLKPLSRNYKLNVLYFEYLILNATFLVDEKKLKDFIARFRSFESSTSKKNSNFFRFEVNGPYLPYTFTEPPEE